MHACGSISRSSGVRYNHRNMLHTRLCKLSVVKVKHTIYTNKNYTSGGTSKQSLSPCDPGVSYFSTHLSVLAVKESKTKTTVGALMQKLYCDSTRVIYLSQ